MKQILIISLLLTMGVTLILNFIHTNVNAWHEHLGIDANKAAELYQKNPNDPAIVQWKSALQLAINDMDKCFEIETATQCVNLIPIIISNCVSHPNTLLACNDSRFPTYPSILKQFGEEEEKSRYLQHEAYGIDILNACYGNSLNATTALNCELEMRSLQGECQLGNDTYKYCKDERLVGYLTQHNLLNSTASP